MSNTEQRAIRMVEERTPMDRFENAIREVGVVVACEWFGHAPDSEFTKETVRILEERAAPDPHANTVAWANSDPFRDKAPAHPWPFSRKEAGGAA